MRKRLPFTVLHACFDSYIQQIKRSTKKTTRVILVLSCRAPADTLVIRTSLLNEVELKFMLAFQILFKILIEVY